MNSSEAKVVADYLVGDFEREMQTTVRVLRAAPEGGLDYRPDGKSKTGLGLLRHIALEDSWLLNSIVDGVFPPPPDDSDACGIGNAEEAVAHYQKQTSAALERVKGLTGEQWVEVLDMFGMFQARRLDFLSMTAKHVVHHRGQLTAYLRAMGGSVPSVYGPSGDTQ